MVVRWGRSDCLTYPLRFTLVTLRRLDCGSGLLGFLELGGKEGGGGREKGWYVSRVSTLLPSTFLDVGICSKKKNHPSVAC